MAPLREEWTNAKVRPSCYGVSSSLDALLARRTLNAIPYFVGSLFVFELSFLESRPPHRPGDPSPEKIERLLEKALRVVRKRLGLLRKARTHRKADIAYYRAATKG